MPFLFPPALVAPMALSAAPEPLPALDPTRIRAIAAALPETPAGVGRPIADRTFWDRLAKDPAYAKEIGRAETFLASPLPPWRGDLYQEYAKNGNRTRYQNAESLRRNRLAPLVLAECLENKGRFLPAIASLIDALCAEPTWVLPAHDGTKMENFLGKTIDIELWSSALGAQLGTADFLLGERLPAASRQNLRNNVKRRILDPFRDMIDRKRPPNWWMVGTNNWNAVCLAGVTGAALAEEPSREERARFVAAAERYSQFFLSGFTADGYCGEGLGYWNYGFGNYYVMAENIRQATKGAVDLLALPGVRMPALFAARIQVQNGISPAFADCPVFAQPSAPLMHVLSHRFGLNLPAYAQLDTNPTLGSLFEAMVYATGENAPVLPEALARTSTAQSGLPIRDFFDAAGILVSRPGPGGTALMGVALKGGNNAESHNHNDVGSYVVVVGDRPVLVDPGPEVYTARTFGPRRYDSNLLNSFGHPVPRIGGTLQHTGAEARGKVLRTDFSPAADTFALDIASAYTIPDLLSLTRTWVYSRAGDGKLTVTDEAKFRQPQTFGTAVLTLGSYQKQDDGSLLISDGDSAITLHIDTGGHPYTIHSEAIREESAVHPTRIGIDLDAPTADAKVTLTITPVRETAEATDGNLLRNGGFERGTYGWSLNAMGEISTAQKAGGKSALRLHDEESNRGSDIASLRALLPPSAQRLILTGTALFASGGGIGLYVRFFDADNKTLSVVDANGNEHPAGTLTGGAAALNRWQPFSYPIMVPPGAKRVQLWLHSFNGTLCDAYLDDLTLRPEK